MTARYGKTICVVFILFLAAALFDWIAVDWSKSHGRLACPPECDDVVYFSAGLRIATAFTDQGVTGLIDYLSHYGTHSPYSEFLAGITIYFFGYSPEALYRANTVLVFAYISALYYFLQPLRLRDQVLLMGMFLCLPFTLMCAVEFRPDLAWAVALGFNSISLITNRRFYEGKLPSLTCGCLLSIALLVKPTTFPMTLLISCLALSCRFLLELTHAKFLVTIQRALISALLTFGTVLIITSPFIYTFGMQTWRYFWENTYGANRDIWEKANEWTTYLWGNAYASNINRVGLILIIGSALLFGFAYRKSGKLYDLYEVGCCWGLAIVALVLNASAPLTSSFLGGAIYGNLLFTAAYIYGRYLPYLETSTATALRWIPLSTRICIVILLPAIIEYHLPPASLRNAADGRYLQNLESSFEDYLSKSPHPQAIGFTQVSPITRENVEIWYFLQHHPAPLLDCRGLDPSFEEEWMGLQPCDLIVAQNTGLLGGETFPPSEQWQDKLVQRLQNDQRYHVVLTCTDGRGKFLYIFRRLQSN